MNLVSEANTSVLLGMQDSAPAVAMRESEALLLLNWRPTPDGSAQVRYGSKRLHAAALNSGAQGLGGVPFRTTAGVVQWVSAVGDSMYYSTDEGETWTLIASGLRADYWDFATMRKSGTTYLLCANGGTNSYKWDGSSWGTISGIRSGTKRIEVHNDRLAATDGVVVDLSKIGDFEGWSAPSAVLGLDVQTHDGDADITAFHSWGQLLLIFKRGSTAYIEGYGSRDLIVAAGSKGISRDVGCIAFRTLQGVGGRGVMFLSRRGFEFLAPGLEPILVSKPVETFLADINRQDIEADPGIPCAYFYPKKLAYECWLPGASGQNEQAFGYRIPTLERPGACYVMDTADADGQAVEIDADGDLVVGSGSSRLRTKGGDLEVVDGPPWAYAASGADLDLASNDTAPSAVFPADRENEAQVPISVGYDGFVRQMDTGSMDDKLSDDSGGTAIGDRFKSRLMVMGDPFRKKRARVVRVILTPESAVTPSVAVIADGIMGTPHTLTLSGSTSPVQKEVRVSARGKELTVDIQNAGAGTRLSGVLIMAEPLVDRP